MKTLRVRWQARYMCQDCRWLIGQIADWYFGPSREPFAILPNTRRVRRVLRAWGAPEVSR